MQFFILCITFTMNLSKVNKTMLRFSSCLLLMGLFFNFSPESSGQDLPQKTDRKSAAAGRFYPGDARGLHDTLEKLFAGAKPRKAADVTAIVCPHAGYVFSGEVAASGYNQVDPDRQFDNVFVIASSHQVSFPGASIYTPGDYVTPLGKVEVNAALAMKLIRENPLFTFNPEADRSEHSLEVQVPFLQYHLKKKFKLVPVVLGTQSAETCQEIANALSPWFNDRNLFVFSTDFSHYPSYSGAQQADKATCDAIISGDPETLTRFLKQYSEKNIPGLVTNLCGWTSILVMLNLVSNHPGMEISPVQYMNSGDSKHGDKSGVVGYWSLALAQQAKEQPETAAFGFSTEEKTTLLKIARSTIEKYVRDRRMPEDDTSKYGERLKIRAGAFVTLKEGGVLRGCIGRFSADMPLYKLIREMAVAASTEDSRFEPVKPYEISRLEIEISVLSPLKKISLAAEIIIGKHGIYVKKGYSSGTFLPQVATENGWTVEEFLGRCARDKASIGWDGWKTAELFTYEACVFSEKEISEGRD
jgi:AmmeMemoRadiSam system protein B/AmmeMemoRadiSam system protein A